MIRYICLVLGILISGCGNAGPSEASPDESYPKLDSSTTTQSVDISPTEVDTLPLTILNKDTSELERSLISQNLINIQKLDPEIRVDLKYSTEDNFLHEDVYGSLERCYLQKEVALMLSKAQRLLKAEHPELNLLIYDGVRPRLVQMKMWDIVKGTPQQNYVAPPTSGSMHNYGAAVDLGLIHDDGTVIDMGTTFDFFGPLAQPRYEEKYLRSGALTLDQAQNRWILRRVMKEAGFHIILSEWWHFNAFERKETRTKYKLVE